MEVSRDYAHSVAAARKRMRTVLSGTGIIIIPCMANVKYHSVHYLPKPIGRSVQCPGRERCECHHLEEIQKMHVPSFVNARRLRYDEAIAVRVEDDQTFHPERWVRQIVELTESTFAVAEEERPFGAVAVVCRPPGKRNGKLEFRWLDGDSGLTLDSAFSIADLSPLIVDKVFRTVLSVKETP